MNNNAIQQLYKKISGARKVSRVAEIADTHRNTVRNQFTGVSPLDPEMLEAATKVLEEMVLQEQETKKEIEQILAENAPLLAGLD